MSDLSSVFAAATAAKQYLATLPAGQHKELLEAMAAALLQSVGDILTANEKDLQDAQGRIPDVMLDRLRLSQPRIEEMAAGMRAVASLDSPLGKVESEIVRPNGLLIRKCRVPMGVIAIIYESRPNVTADCAALCIASGNVCILRGGSDAINTNSAIESALRRGLEAAGGPVDAVQLIKDTTHDSARALMEARGFVDLLIPRGGKNLIQATVEGARGVPVIETGTGICHIYVDKDANLSMAASILYNAKTSRPSVCNSAEVCLVHKDVAATFLPMAKTLLDEKNVQLRLDERAAAIVSGAPAGSADFDTEFLDYILAVGIVDSLDTAIEHVNHHSTGHSDAIITQNQASAAEFCDRVDSAAVYVNASTRFTDGGEFGLGCEMGISTQKVGVRGPMGLYELTSYKYVVSGNGQIR